MGIKLRKINNKIGIIGLGYVGLPLAVNFGKYYKILSVILRVNPIKEK